jgi:regulator of protease activity HflC (stomatin/prohibitin superfamily)
MFGLRFVKVLPTTYLMAYRGGRLVREGAGLAILAYAPTTSLVAVPIASRDAPFIFEQVTRDFQSVTVQGQVAYRVADPRKLAAMLNFALAANFKSYESDDPQKLPQRVLGAVEVLVQQAVRAASLADVLQHPDRIARDVEAGLRAHPEIVSLGLEVLGVAILAIKPTPETARALEAEAREAILKRADEAIFQRRNFAIERERAIRESELDTEVAVEQKKRLIRETQMEAEASVQRQRHALRQADMESDIALEDRRKALVAGNAENARVQAEAEAYRVAVVMKALAAVDPRIVQALAAIGMNPGQLIAQAFGGIAERAERIGQLNVSPELLQSLVGAKAADARHAR